MHVGTKFVLASSLRSLTISDFLYAGKTALFYADECALKQALGLKG